MFNYLKHKGLMMNYSTQAKIIQYIENLEIKVTAQKDSGGELLGFKAKSDFDAEICVSGISPNRAINDYKRWLKVQLAKNAADGKQMPF